MEVDTGRHTDVARDRPSDALRGFRRGPVEAALIVALLVTACGGASQDEGTVRHPCDYVSNGDLNAIAEGKWSSSRTKQGTFETCKFDDPGDMGHLIPPSFAVVSISTAYPSWDAIAKNADSTPVGGLGDDAYRPTGARQAAVGGAARPAGRPDRSTYRPDATSSSRIQPIESTASDKCPCSSNR